MDSGQMQVLDFFRTVHFVQRKGLAGRHVDGPVLAGDVQLGRERDRDLRRPWRHLEFMNRLVLLTEGKVIDRLSCGHAVKVDRAEVQLDILQHRQRDGRPVQVQPRAYHELGLAMCQHASRST